MVLQVLKRSINERPIDLVLDEPLKGLIALRLEIVSFFRKDDASQSTNDKLQFSLRAAILGCQEGM